MEWIETTGKTVAEARETALDQLGVDESEVEFEVVQEPKPGLFGRTRGIARVRARIVPKAPRAKTDRKRRPKKGSANDGSGSPSSTGRPSTTTDTESSPRPAQKRQGAAKPKTDGDRGTKTEVETKGSSVEAESASSGNGRNSPNKRTRREDREPMDPDQQIAVVEGFVTGLLAAFDLKASLESSLEGRDLVTNIVGENLGILVGHRLGTLEAIQELARLALQREAEGKEYARVSIDVAGVRATRSESLGNFVRSAADRVVSENKTVVFEDMNSVDRKLVHDLASTIEGVSSVSEGEDPRRRVALVPK